MQKINAPLRVMKMNCVSRVPGFDQSFEQAVEKDFVLPDYCPDVFRILKCRVEPRILSHSINGSKLTVEAEAAVRVLYLSDQNGRINVLEHKLGFSKTFDLPADARSPLVRAAARLDYVNCRVVSRRRVDVRGAFTVRVRVTNEASSEFITSAEGAGIQLRKSNTLCPARRFTASKRVTVIEELELGGAKPAVGAVLRSSCSVSQTEQKVIAGKLITKGEATVSLLYTPAGDGSPEAMRFGIPYSQIIDIEGIDESCAVDIETVCAACNILPRAEEPERMECELILLINCEAVKYESCEAVTDAFSTTCSCTCEPSETPLGSVPVRLKESFRLNGELTAPDPGIGSVISAWGETSSVSVREENGKSIVSGSLTVSAVGTDTNGTALWLETDIPFEYETEGGLIPEAEVSGGECSFRLTERNRAEVECELTVTGICSAQGDIIPLRSLEVGEPEERPGGRRCAVTLCRVGPGEELWELAKRCRTSVSAITEENDLASDKTEAGGMLLIPMID
ncbi:MAG: DUF3794 domain-containing protein [Ruminococcus sp.]|nr:DUF3794 domain-containing protein [Ruminococcus sp.]